MWWNMRSMTQTIIDGKWLNMFLLQDTCKVFTLNAFLAWDIWIFYHVFVHIYSWIFTRNLKNVVVLATNFVGNVSRCELCSSSSYHMLGNVQSSSMVLNHILYVGNIVQVRICNGDIISIQHCFTKYNL